MIQQILNGLIIGSMYALVAIGFTLVLGVLDRLNFAHTEIFMLGGFVGLVVIQGGGPLWLTLPVAFAVCGGLGLVVELVCFRRIEGDARITAALSSVAAGLIIDDLLQKVYGTDPPSLPLPAYITDAGVRFLDTHLTYLDLLIVGVTLGLMLALQLYVARSRTGRAIRAVADSHVAASLLGINVRRVTQQVFFLSAGLAGVAGVLYALRTDIANLQAGLTFGLKALAVMAIGGMGDVRGAVIGGLAVGVLEGLAFYWDLGGYSDLVVWIAMILVLLVRPAGLFGGGVHVRETRA
jgi:branched-chain amino acid transport system permease protein